MCNIAGYVGTQAAAPILLGMMERQAGFGGGYYTGIATLYEGELHSEKVLGDMDRLYAASDVRSLPGNVGIIHSRSNSGGDREWAHPFLSNDETLAYVANGSTGAFARLPEFNRDLVSLELEHRGVQFRSKSAPVGAYPRLTDGSGVHVSEVMCHLIRMLISEGFEPEAAMRRAFLANPSEIVALALHVTMPDTILAARYNQPMMLGRADDGVYLATTALAFPPDVCFHAIDLLPTDCSATIHRDGWCIHGFSPAIPVAALDAGLLCGAQTAILRYINAASEPVTVGDCCDITHRLWPQDMLAQNAVLCYEALRALVHEGDIAIVSVVVPGAPEGAADGIMSTSLRFIRA
ncbi:MAG: hypothetical protein VB111_03840 [Clostridiaceae bacterium]|nr:hypothetical protein [Clostridiaceae bacterium]